MPMTADAAKLELAIARLGELADAAGRPMPEVVAFGGIALDDPARGADQLAALGAIGVTRFATGGRYDDASGFRRLVDGLVAVRDAGG
jgi:hypothetical protein